MLGPSCAYVLSQVSTFPTISECRSMFFGAACSDCPRTGFVPFEKPASDCCLILNSSFGSVKYVADVTQCFDRKRVVRLAELSP